MDDPEIATRIAQYEMAFRMQASVPGDRHLNEPQSVSTVRQQPGDGSFASTACWPAAWRSAASASSSSITRTGTITAASKRASR